MNNKKDDSAILNILYPVVAKKMKANSDKFKKQFAKFVNDRTKELFCAAPSYRMPFGTTDADEIFKAVDITRAQVKNAIMQTYYWDIAAFNPRYAKDEITILLLCIVRYYILAKDEKAAGIASAYLGFSGKFYPSIHSNSFPKAEPAKYEYVMDYVINHFSNKFMIKTEGHVIGTVTAIGKSWISTYENNRFKSFDDEDVAYLVQQLRNRIKSFIKNVASLYYSAYERRDYITFDSECNEEDNFHLTDSDSLKAERAVENAMSKINSMSIDYRYCKMSSDNLVHTDEVKSIMESIMDSKDNRTDVKDLVRLLVYTYFSAPKSDKDVSSIRFITFSVSPKSNTKDANIIRIKEIVEGWLMTSERYRKRRSRLATKNSYFKSIVMYFTLMIHIANK